MHNILLSDTPLDIQQCIEWIRDTKSGGIDIFIGSVRDKTKDKEVIKLEFEAYESMAVGEMKKIADKSFSKWHLHKVLIHHRTGSLQPGEIPVIIAVSAAHRNDAFEACRFIIDTLKQTVPIWKKEVYVDGEVWVAAHP
jgi:molybdopterin synthase catalytic subunit